MTAQVDGRFGPNTEAVETFIEQIKNLTPEQVLRVQEEGARDVATDGTWDFATDMAYYNGRSAAVQLARDEIRMIAYDLWDEATRTIVYDKCGDLISNAVVALVVADLLDQEDFDELYGAWANVMKTGETPKIKAITDGGCNE